MYAKGEFDAALAKFVEALKIDPNYSDAQCDSGVVYMEKDDWPTAITLLEKAIALDQKNPKAHYALAVCYARRQNPDFVKAKEYRDKAESLGYHIVPWFDEFLKKNMGTGPAAQK